MGQLNVRLPEEQLEALKRYAERRRTPVSWLIKDYVEHLLRGGRPVTETKEPGGDLEDLPTALLVRVAEEGGSFDWLADEPDLYSAKDGEPV